MSTCCFCYGVRRPRPVGLNLPLWTSRSTKTTPAITLNPSRGPEVILICIQHGGSGDGGEGAGSGGGAIGQIDEYAIDEPGSGAGETATDN